MISSIFLAFYLARVRGVDALYIRVYLALIRVQNSRYGHGRRIGAAAAQGSYVSFLSMPWKPAITTILRLSSSRRMRSVETRTILAEP